MTKHDLIHVCRGLLKPLLQQPGSNLGPCLIEKAIEAAGLARDTSSLNATLLREHIQRFEGGNIESQEVRQSILLQTELFLGGLKLIEKLHGNNCGIKRAKGQIHLRLGNQIREILLEQVVQSHAHIGRGEVLLVLHEREVHFAHLKRVCHLLSQKLIRQADNDTEFGICGLVVELDYERFKAAEVLIVRELGDLKTALV